MVYLKFPSNFLFGSATSAYQVEGGIENSDWSQFYSAGRACDHYNLYELDFNLLKKLGQNAYRFSIEWSRIEPKEGQFDQKEIEHYRKVLQALKDRNIKTMVTLHHFTIPVWLARLGGWANSKVIFYFKRFSQKLLQEYKNQVDFWITINEPLIYATKGYLEGTWPPNKRNPILFLKVLQNQIKAHRQVYEVFHKDNPKVKVGLAKNNQFFEPYNRNSLLDRISVATADYLVNKYFLNRIKDHLDFIGLNYYFHNKIKFPYILKNENRLVSDLGWEIYPEGIYYTLLGLKDYNKPIYVTENGVADSKDALRADFIHDHLYWIHKAIQEGANVCGYFYWSLIDNFEWDKGFEPRFGLVEVDYNTLERKPRASAYYYAKICKNGK